MTAPVALPSDSLDTLEAEFTKIEAEAKKGPLHQDVAYEYWNKVNGLHDRLVALERGPYSGRASDLFAAFRSTRENLVRWLGDHNVMGL